MNTFSSYCFSNSSHIPMPSASASLRFARGRGLFAAALVALLPTALAAQWRVRPIAAAGVMLPANAASDIAATGGTVKLGLLIQQGVRPFAVSPELLMGIANGGLPGTPRTTFTLGSATLNISTRRHPGRFDWYLIGGAGVYGHGEVPGLLSAAVSPGLNVGIGENLSVGSLDVFAEFRYHVVRGAEGTASRDRETLSFIPITIGVRF